MFALAIFIGLYSFLLFALGLAHLLYPISVGLLTCAWIVSMIIWFRGDFRKWWKNRKKYLANIITLSNYSKFVLLLILLIWIINLVGALAPVTAFDALWYHLTIPKLFIQQHAVVFLPGELYSYSLMPKLIDMLFVPAVMARSGVGASLIHYTFGILCCIALFRVSRRFLSLSLSLLVVLIFSSNLVVMWEATTAYIDLGRTFFEIMGFWGLLLYLDEKKELWFVESAINLGFAISAKLLAIGSIGIFAILLLLLNKRNILHGLRLSVKYIFIALAVCLPYFIFSFLSTGNPVYPFFTNLYPTGIESEVLSITKFIRSIWNVFVTGEDPVNPIYLMLLPLVFIVVPKLQIRERLVALYCLFGLLVWYITPHTGGGRFILAYLPMFSVFAGIVISNFKNKTVIRMSISMIVLIAVLSIGYRTIATLRYMPVVFGNESRNEFLTKHLNFDFGDFYDTDGYFDALLTKNDTVLVYGVHNLFYANFPFIHASLVKPGDTFNYILVGKDASLPKRFDYWQLVYVNPVSHTKLYALGGKEWVY